MVIRLFGCRAFSTEKLRRLPLGGRRKFLLRMKPGGRTRCLVVKEPALPLLTGQKEAWRTFGEGFPSGSGRLGGPSSLRTA